MCVREVDAGGLCGLCAQQWTVTCADTLLSHCFAVQSEVTKRRGVRLAGGGPSADTAEY